MPMIFSVVALVVDGSTLMAQRRSIQNAADAAALAASQELPAGGPCAGASTDPYPSSCQSRVLWTANHYSHDVNGGPAITHPCVGVNDVNCYTNPYKGSDQLVEVRLRESVVGFFTAAAHIAGPFDVSARAVGSAAPIVTGHGSTASTSISTRIGTTNPGTTIPGSTSTSFSTTTTFAGNIALFAKDSVCGSNNGITLGNTGNSLHVTGLSITNGSATIDGNPQTHLDYLTYGGPNHCTIGGTRGPGAVGTTTVHDDVRDWPKTWDSAAICSMPGATVYNDTLTHTVPNNASGIYCALNGGLALGGDGNITMIAKTITFPVQTVHISAFFDNLLFYQTQGDMTFIPNNSNVNGWIWVPNGRLTYGGNSASQGFYEAFDISIQGNSFDITGTGPLSEPTTSTSSTTTSTPPTTITGVTDPGSTVTSTIISPGTTDTVGTTHGLDE
jgi:Putative Flp pilus-assembly TadE/G-like